MNEACRACPVRLLGETAQLLQHAVDDVVPPEAQVHLLNAQRELLLAVKVTAEHHLHRDQERRRRAQRRRPVRLELE